MPVSTYPMTRLDDLLETLWNLEDMHRDVSLRLERLITQLETTEREEASPVFIPYS